MPEKIKLFNSVLKGNDVSIAFKVIMKLHSLKKIGDFKDLQEKLAFKDKLKENQAEHDKIKGDLKAVFDKNNCFDIFKFSKIDGKPMFEPMLNKKRLKLKLERSKLTRSYMKIMLILNLKAVDKILMIKARLQAIEIQKKLFIQEI